MDRPLMNEVLIKSRARVRDRGEVFTAEREVNAMLDLLPISVFEDPLATFLEPACGTGNFLVAILARKLACDDGSVMYTEKCVSSLYGVDIAGDNVQETRARMLQIALDHGGPHTHRTLSTILAFNIVQGDFLKGIDSLGLVPWDWLFNIVPSECCTGGAL